MASINLKRKSTSRARAKFSLRDFIAICWHYIIVGILLTISLYLFVAMVSYNPLDMSSNTVSNISDQIHNLMGLSGAYIADMFLQFFGVGALLLPAFLGMCGYRFLKQDDISPLSLRILSILLAMIFVATAGASITTFFWLAQSHMGGLIGHIFLNLMNSMIPDMGILSSKIIISILSFGIGLFLFNVAIALRPDERELLMAHMLKGGSATMQGANSAWNKITSFRRSNDHEEDTEYEDDEDAEDENQSEDEDEEDDSYEERSRPISVVKPQARTQKPKTKKSEQTKFDLREPSEWELPPKEFLQNPPKQVGEQLDESALRKNADLLQNVLSDYNVSGDITSIHPGPVVTLYELEPSPGTKTSRVVGLSDDIARSMSAVSVRVAVVPGRNVIGIELPNKKRQTVYLKELLEQPEFDDHGAKLPLVLGKDIGGQPIIADLARMPHLLVAGTTGSGKSVAVNTMILSLLYKLPPEKCRFIMIDPKMLELSVYDDIPHLLAPVVTEPGRAVVALKWTVQEMENRYRNMSKLGVRNIEGYNARVKEARKKGEILMRKVQTGFDAETGKPVFEEQPLDLNEIPYIVVIVDEFADLMLVAGKDVENAIQRLAQMARAAGIHLIMATQRPSVDVITGVIKANFPTRISFQVTSKIDSRTILGEGGAETLLGMGDMLYMAAGGRITRVHGPFVSDKEVEEVVNFLKAQGEPEYLEDVTEGDFMGGDDGGSSSGDELYDRACALVAEEGKASTSFIQRHLQIGYNRAARIIEDMEKNGVVGKANHVGKREVLIGEHRRY
jgi:S-DNA-T family DNA segregation ATPase FtsK/SpoIIIE